MKRCIELAIAMATQPTFISEQRYTSTKKIQKSSCNISGGRITLGSLIKLYFSSQDCCVCEK